MEILVLSPYPPYPPSFGAVSRIYHLVRVLAREHRVSVLSFATPREAEALGPLRAICAAVHTVPPPRARRYRRLYQLRSLVGRPYGYYACYSPALAQALADFAAPGRFDVVQVEFSHMGYYRVPAGARHVLDEHNVEYRLLEQLRDRAGSALRRVYARVQARKFRRDELAACRRMDAVLTTSEVDRRLLAAHLDGVPIEVVPNGVDTAFFAAARVPGGERPPPALLFTGTMSYPPNADAVRYFCAEVLPRVRAAVPGATLAIVGRDPPAAVRRLAGPGIDVTGAVPDVRPWMREAAVFVAPLRMGSGTRLKILEALASGLPVVSTSIGAEGLDVTHEDDLLLADTPESFADAVVACLRRPELRARLGARGRALVEARYDWDAIGAALGRFYRRLVAAGPGEPALRPGVGVSRGTPRDAAASA